MVDYLKNFALKLLLLPVLAILGCVLLAAILLLPQVRLIRDKSTSRSRSTNHGRKEKSQDYEAFY